MAIYKTVIVGREKIAKNTLEISLKRPDKFSFKPGQYIQLGVSKLLYSDIKGSSRVLSIASSPLDKDKISVAFRDTGTGFKRTLKELPMGGSVNIEGPHGYFTLPEDSSRQLVFIAGGIGITPYLSMIRYATDRGLTFPITLLFSNRDKNNAPYFKELKGTPSRNKHFTFNSKFGRIDEQFIVQKVKNIKECAWHIAGPAAMVDYVQNTLLLLGVDNAQIHKEAFTGY